MLIDFVLRKSAMDGLLSPVLVHVCNDQFGTFSRKRQGCGSPNP